MSEARDHVREQIRTLRHGTATACERIAVRPREGMRENARDLANIARTTDEVHPAGKAQAFELKLKPLTARQLTAINLITMGKTIVAIARTLKVDPGTIHRWRATNPLFAAELNRRQSSLFETIAIKLRLTLEKAVDQLSETLDCPLKSTRAEAMWKLLPMLKPQRLIEPTGPTTAAAIVDAQIRAERLRRGEIEIGEILNDERLAFILPEDLADELEPPSTSSQRSTAAHVEIADHDDAPRSERPCVE